LPADGEARAPFIVTLRKRSKIGPISVRNGSILPPQHRNPLNPLAFRVTLNRFGPSSPASLPLNTNYLLPGSTFPPRVNH
jgi:hypothetical protein